MGVGSLRSAEAEQQLAGLSLELLGRGLTKHSVRYGPVPTFYRSPIV